MTGSYLIKNLTLFLDGRDAFPDVTPEQLLMIRREADNLRNSPSPIAQNIRFLDEWIARYDKRTKTQDIVLTQEVPEEKPNPNASIQDLLDKFRSQANANNNG